jgi:hypothetical protein
VTGGRSGDAPPEIDAGIPTANLTESQKTALCDWHAGTLGGYGHVSQCGMGSVIFYPDQAACLATAFKDHCAKATAGQYIDCVNSTLDSNGCDYTDECRRLYCL